MKIMSKKFGLGKGLNALIPEDTVILEPKKGKDKNDDNGYSLIDINLTNLLLLILIMPPYIFCTFIHHGFKSYIFLI